MTGRYTIEITQEIIDDSIQRDSSHCMIAEAVQRSIPGVGYVSVDLQTIRFSHKRLRKRYVFLTPRRGQIELIKFDQGVTPEPFTLTLQRGQVLDMQDRKANRDSKAQREAKEAEAADQEEIAEKPKRPYKRAELKNAGDSNHDSRVEKVGGRTPPVGALSTARGRVRRFGLKSLAE